MALTKVQTAMTNLGGVNVLDYGATGDGVTDDTTGFQAALTAAAAAGVELVVPAGRYILSNQLTASSADTIKIVGSGSGLTELVWTDVATSGGGLALTYTNKLYPTNVSGLTLLTQSGFASGDIALKIIGPNTPSITNLGPQVSDIIIRGDAPASDTWDIGMEFYDCWYIVAEQFTIKGLDDATAPFDATVGVKLSGCQVTFMSNFNIFHVETGIIEASGSADHGEGFTFQHFEIVGVNNGIVLTNGAADPGTNIGPGHINAYALGIELDDQHQTAIHDMLIYKTQLSVTAFVGISMLTCASCNIHNNFILGLGGAGAANNTIGIKVAGPTSFDNAIYNNQFYDFAAGGTNYGVYVTAAAATTRVYDNASDGSVTCLVIDSTDKTNIASNNLPRDNETFVANDATPSVGNALGVRFDTANSAPTSITNFDDGFTGQQIVIMFNDANTTLVHGATLILRGGVNYVAISGDIFTFIKDATLWREVSRSGYGAAGIFTTLVTSGDVGIGESSPAQRLEVNELDQTGFTGIRINNPNGFTGSAGIEFQVDGTYSKAAIYQVRNSTNGGGDIVFVNDSNFDAANWASTDEKMRITSAGVVQPGADNAATLGSASKRWSEVFAANGTINTSDAREKTAVRSLTIPEIEAAKLLSKEIGIYQWLSSIDVKDADNARQHIGFTVQRAIEIMTSQGLDPMAYGFICYDSWEDEFTEWPATSAVDEVVVDGVVTVEAVEATDAGSEQTQVAGDRYAFRYDQLNLFIARGFEARITALEG